MEQISNTETGNVVIYQTPDGQTKIDVKFEKDTVWLTQQQMSDLFQSSRTNIIEHIKHIYEEGELDESSTCRNFRQVQTEGNRQVTREIPFYNLDMIISLGYRIKSIIATRFRCWATEILKEYMQKGFALDDNRLKELGGGDYWHELLDRMINANGDKVLEGSGSVSHKQAVDKALEEYRKYQVQTLSPVEQAYLEAIKSIEQKAKKAKKE